MYTRYEKGLLETIREMGGIKMEQNTEEIVRMENLLSEKMNWDISVTRKILDNLIDLSMVTYRDGKLVSTW